MTFKTTAATAIEVGVAVAMAMEIRTEQKQGNYAVKTFTDKINKNINTITMKNQKI